MTDRPTHDSDATTHGSGLETLMNKYKMAQPVIKAGAEQAKKAVQKTFDDINAGRYREQATRVSTSPAAADSLAGSSLDIANTHKEMAEFQYDLAELVDVYGKLKLDFDEVIGKKKNYTTKDALNIWVAQVTRNKKKQRQLIVDKATDKGRMLQELVESMSEVFNDLYQKSAEAEGRAGNLMEEIVVYMRQMNEGLIEGLKGGQYTFSDQAAAEKEVKTLQVELDDITNVLMDYETKVRAARAENKVEEIKRLTDDMAKVLDIQQGVLEGKLQVEGVNNEIRTEILKYAEQVQSSKGAIAAAEVNYQLAASLRETFAKLKIKYDSARTTMIPTFRQQAEISGMALAADKSESALEKTAELMQRNMELNVKFTQYLAAKSFELIKNPFYEPEKLRKIRDEVLAEMDELHRQEDEWAQQMQTVRDEADQARYQQPQ